MENASDNDPLLGGSCTTLLPQVIDRYFFADYHTERFRWDTALQICARCVVKAACLENAITNTPPEDGIVAGHGVGVIRDLRAEYLAGTPVEELVDRRMQLDAKRIKHPRYLHPKPESRDA